MSGAVIRKKAASSPANNNTVDVSILEEKLGYQLRITDRALSRGFYQIAGLTQVQFSVFSLVATNENLSQVTVGEALNMDRASTMAIVHKLELAGLLERRKSPHDRRMHALQLTSNGKKEFARINKLVTAHDNSFRDKLTKKELETLLKCLQKLRD